MGLNVRIWVRHEFGRHALGLWRFEKGWCGFASDYFGGKERGGEHAPQLGLHERGDGNN